ncbi:U32 family peptidase [Piscinibacter sp. Jin2]|uniref:U32 family peptidase n=1 Tax=Aquariibacter lacus TaxID=2801332 RepID=A0A9X0XEQ4_9BURK|nr:U32 family peptidase [Piscinibacter lacus]MBL0720554.1 U32 family peptidase [Piscinibacter lacus]
MPLRPDLELLAPARDADIGIEAVNHGADAVYIGGPAFGARDKAGNAMADIARLCAHAQRYGSRIFLTINTILRDDELEAARRMVWQAWDAGVDALIVQDMGLLELDLPPIQLHASTQCDIRTPEKARFLQDAGFSQLVLARELTLPQIAACAQALDHAAVEFFVHGALCVAYSGQCFISHAHTGRSANRGNCSQECRLPYTVTDAAGGIVAHDKHVLSLKDNDQSANLAALVDAGVRSFKIEGRYKDLGYVKNLTAHYRQLIDALLEERGGALKRASSGRCRFSFTPDPQRNFNRGSTDYFATGRKIDIGAFDTPKHAGLPLGEVLAVGAEAFDVALDPDAALSNGDGLSYFDLQTELVGLPVNRAERLTAEAAPADGKRRAAALGEPGANRWRVWPPQPCADFKDLRAGTALHRNRDRAWDRLLDKPSAERRIALDLALGWDAAGLSLALRDEDGHEARVRLDGALPRAEQAAQAEATLRQQLGKLGGTIFSLRHLSLPRGGTLPFVPASALNGLRREGVVALEAARAAAFRRLERAAPVEPPAPYPGEHLSYLANVHNHKARDFYARHGVQIIEAAYESHTEPGEVSLMITKHCVRFSLSLCPKQAKGVTGVQGQVKAEPLQIRHGDELMTLRFDCKPCEMHVVGRMKPQVMAAQQREIQASEAAGTPIRFYRQRPQPASA